MNSATVAERLMGGGLNTHLATELTVAYYTYLKISNPPS